MNLDDAKDQIKEQFATTKQKVVESDAYATAQEKYELLNPSAQKILKISLVLLLTFLVLFLPVSTLLSANDKIADFEENKSLIRKLLKVNRKLKQSSNAPPPISVSTLKSRVNSTLGNIGLLPEQILTHSTTNPDLSHLIPKEISSEGLRVSLTQLNLTQISNVGLALQNIDKSIKVTSMNISASAEDDHYFDVNYELTTFNIPFKEETEENNKRKSKRRRN